MKSRPGRLGCTRKVSTRSSACPPCAAGPDREGCQRAPVAGAEDAKGGCRTERQHDEQPFREHGPREGALRRCPVEDPARQRRPEQNGVRQAQETGHQEQAQLDEQLPAVAGVHEGVQRLVMR